MTASVMTTTGGPESSDDCLRDTVTGDEKLPLQQQSLPGPITITQSLQAAYEPFQMA